MPTGDAPPFRAKNPDYASCVIGPLFQHGRTGLSRAIQKNTTAVPGGAVNGTTGESTLLPLGGLSTNGGTCPDGITHYGNPTPPPNTISGDVYDGTNYGTNGSDGKPIGGGWDAAANANRPVNTYALMSAVNGMSVADGGSGYTLADVGAEFSIAGGSPESISGGISTQSGTATGRIKSVDVATGKVTAVILENQGIYAANPASPNTPTASTLGTGLQLGLTFGLATFDFGKECAVIGYQACAAKRYWHGRFGFLSHDVPGGLTSVLCSPTDTNPAPYGYETEQLTADDTKFLTLTIESNLQYNFDQYQVFDPPDPTFGDYAHSGRGRQIAHFNCAQIINPNSGEITFSGFDVGVEGWTDGADVYPGTFVAIGNILPSSGGITPGEEITLQDLMSLFINGENNFPTADEIKAYLRIDGSEWNIDTLNYSITNTTITLQVHATATSNFPSGPPWNGRPEEVDTTSCNLVITLSNPNTEGAVKLDARENLLAPWNFNDPVLFPIANSAWNGVMVKVTRNEHQGNVTFISFPFRLGDQDQTTGIWTVTNTVDDLRYPVADATGNAPFTSSWVATYTPMAWIDMTAWRFIWSNPNVNGSGNSAASALEQIYDGSILGLPNTEGGDFPKDYFDSRYLEYASACNTPPSMLNRVWYIKNYGGWRNSALAMLPPRATQWTNKREAAGLTYARVSRYAVLDVPEEINGEAVLWETKIAETVIRLPSFDHARPYGADRLLLKPDGCCDTSGDDPVWNYGGTVVDGVCTPLAGTVYPPETLPSAAYRFPNCPPFGGRLAITGITDNGDGTCQVTHEATAEPIDAAVPSGQLFPVNLCGKGMVLISGNQTVVTSGVGSFKVTASYASIKDAVWLTLYGALPGDPAQTGVARWYWDDTRGKGDYALMEWNQDLRTSGEIGRLTGVQDCSGTQVALPTANRGWYEAGTVFTGKQKVFIACTGWKFVLSPNDSDTPPPGTGSRSDFSVDQALDERYGSYQTLRVSQAMTDPLYVAIPSNLQTTCDGSEPVTCYPLVETRVNPPVGGSDTANNDPDHGAGIAQNEPAPSGGSFMAYLLKNPADYDLGDGAIYPPAALNAGDQPLSNLVPSGIWTPCP